MALGLNVFNLFYKFKVLVLVTLFVMVLWTTFSYLVDTRQEIAKAKSMVEFFRKVTSLEHSQKEEKIESTADVPMVKSFEGPCPALSPYLRGASKLSFKPLVTLEEVQKKNPLVAKGRYHPVECSALQHVAILIPHRNREKHLLYLLQHLHPFLQRQQLDYGIYVIHQVTQLCRASLGEGDGSVLQPQERLLLSQLSDISPPSLPLAILLAEEHSNACNHCWWHSESQDWGVLAWECL